MTIDENVADFARAHSFDPSELLFEERTSISCAVDCHAAINAGYAGLSTDVLETDATVGLLWQLHERCTERVFGALVAMATNCPASSEIVARSAIEATVAFRYILASPAVRLASFFQNHVDQAARQELAWRKEAEMQSGDLRGVHIAACDYRRTGVAAMARFVARVNSELGFATSVPPWPSIAARFSAVGDALGYRTFYARLCSEPHLDAEETLRFLLGQSAGQESFEKMAMETAMYARFVLAEAVRGYAEAGGALASAYAMETAVATCSAAERTMLNQAEALSQYVGGLPA